MSYEESVNSSCVINVVPHLNVEIVKTEIEYFLYLSLLLLFNVLVICYSCGDGLKIDGTRLIN